MEQDIGQNSKAIFSVMFFIEKQDGTIKVCTCADGRKHQLYRSKEEVAATVLLESIFVMQPLKQKMEGMSSLWTFQKHSFMQKAKAIGLQPLQ